MSNLKDYLAKIEIILPARDKAEARLRIATGLDEAFNWKEAIEKGFERLGIT